MRHAKHGPLLAVYGLMSLAAGSLAAASFGPDLPPTGHSLFDELVGDDGVPYPFSRLVAHVNARMQSDPGGLPPLKLTLIPLGRSLQRDAGAPDFFRFPRVVAAADGANRPGHPVLRDRLFLGYHETAGMLEVISYNDAAARFEFQVVHDYRAGATPRVSYARRALCLACHQNAAPIFARPLWDETSANPTLANTLRNARRSFYGQAVTGTDIAYFIDAATDRASLFAVWQAIWQHGCGAGPIGDDCRRDAFNAALAYARSHALPTTDALPALNRNWTRAWPNGLPIPSADLPNRNPLAALQPPGIDPLLPRASDSVWQRPDTTAFVVGLAGMLDAAAVARLGDRDATRALNALRTRGVFGAQPFTASLLAETLRELGLATPSLSRALPVPRIESVSTPHPRHARLHAHCGACHDTSLAHPPNFLRGTPSKVETQLVQCAPRMFVRLSLAESGPRARRMSPMPPATALASRGLTSHAWSRSTEFAALKASLIARLGGRVSETLLRMPYDSLPPCLPSPTYGGASR